MEGMKMKLDSFFNVNRKVSFLLSLGISFLIIGMDLLSPPQLQFTIFFILPILIAGWYNGLRWALTLSIALPLIRFFIAAYIEPLWQVQYDVINAINRMIVFSIISVIVSRLSSSLKHIKILEGMVPICSNCKKIRDDNQTWQPLENYIQQHSEAHFTHGLCPECTKLLFGNYLKKQ
jgi:hypothetical protein